MKVIATGNWRCSQFHRELAALGYPPEWRKHEIRDLPADLWEKISAGRTPLDTDAGLLEEHQHRQPRFEMLNRQWRDNRAEEQARTRAKNEAYLVEQEVHRQQALEDTKKLETARAKARKTLGIGG